MGRQPKRTRILANKAAATEITIRPITREKDGSVWITHLVQGWKEDGKWKRRQFAERADAERFAALKRVEVENKGRAQRMVLSPLTDGQHEEALGCFDRLAGTYTLADAVAFFLKHHRPPEFTIRLRAALKLFLDDKERSGLRPRTLQALNASIERFIKSADDPWTHEVTHQQVEGYLRGLRSADGEKKASKKFWNNTLNDLKGFFAWSATPDRTTNRPFTFENPAASVRAYDARQVREEQNARPATTDLETVLRMFSVLMRWRGGVMVRYYALAYFAGIRPAEIQRLNGRETELINFKTRTITIPANISKTRHERHIVISDNLAAWLEAFPAPILSANFGRMLTEVKKHFKISHDEARHSFISYHVALHRSMGDAALQAGNSESIIRRHYLNLHPREDGEEFFRIVPGHRRARLAPSIEERPPHLKAV